MKYHSNVVSFNIFKLSLNLSLNSTDSNSNSPNECISHACNPFQYDGSIPFYLLGSISLDFKLCWKPQQSLINVLKVLETRVQLIPFFIKRKKVDFASLCLTGQSEARFWEGLTVSYMDLLWALLIKEDMNFFQNSIVNKAFFFSFE